MTALLLAAASEAERNAFPTLSRLSERDVDSIWSNVAFFIERQMAMQKGVCISGLGTFSFSQLKLDVGNKPILIQRPVFLLSERLCQSHGLKQTKPLAAAGDIPVVPLNFAALSVDSLYDRDVVEGCVRETLLLLLRVVASQRTVVFTFKGIGILLFRHGNVKMKFYKDFVSTMDGTGKLLWALTNRPGTSSSVVSANFSRPGTSNAILLPKISLRELPRKAEENEASDLPSKPPPGGEQKNGREMLSLDPPKSGLPIANSYKLNSTDDSEAKGLPFAEERHVGFSEPQEGTVEQVEVNKEEHFSNQVCLNHTRAGQELCYLCMQRAQRNVPLYLSEERQREEKEEEKILLLAEQQRDEQFLQREQAEQEEKRENYKKIAVFNMDIAEASKAKRSARPSQLDGSYIFHGRPVTPPLLLKQRRYMQELVEQAAFKRQQHAQSRRDHELAERLHQFQLRDEIAKQKSQELRQKKENVKGLQKALGAQLESQSTGIPARVPDSDGPVFGVRDGAPAALAEQKQRAQRLYQEQLSAANNKRKEALLNHLNEQRKERDMLDRSRKELIAERLSRYERLKSLQASLEDTWSRGVNLKRHRDLEEKAFIRSGSKLLMDQCEQYRRCYQCKRKTSNCGESNIWKESHYIPGSRLMV